ncbi:hypothetical protein Plhal304r1_c001g0000221 [Plasmopara halstedii]
MSTNAKQHQEENVERLIKCRLRSEIEARKAVESTMRRAVKESRELKKELVVLRQEKEDLKMVARKQALLAASGNKEVPRGGNAGPNNKFVRGDQEHQKAVVLKLKQQVQDLITKNTDLETDNNKMQQQIFEYVNSADLEKRTREIISLSDELKKSKLVVNETKRKCQKLLREKEEELQRAIQENAQLTCCTRTLQSQLASLPQLKKQLEHAKERRNDAAEVWRKKLELRDEAFLRAEEVSKQNLIKSAAQVAGVTDEKEHLQARLEELERKFYDVNVSHQTELSLTTHCRRELESTIKQLQQKLLAAETATYEAERATVVARETQRQETRFRQLAEDAADAVEIRAEKAERDLAHAQMQLEHLEEALKARGITFEYLLKLQTSGSSSGQSITTRGAAIKQTIVSTATEPPTRSKIITKSRVSTVNRKSLKPQKSNNNGDDRQG